MMIVVVAVMPHQQKIIIFVVVTIAIVCSPKDLVESLWNTKIIIFTVPATAFVVFHLIQQRTPQAL